MLPRPWSSDDEMGSNIGRIRIFEVKALLIGQFSGLKFILDSLKLVNIGQNSYSSCGNDNSNEILISLTPNQSLK